MRIAAPLSQDEALALHRRLADGDPVASADLAESFLEYLAQHLIERNGNVDPILCYEAAEDTLLSLIKRPSSYRPERGSLDTYMRMSASADLKNLLRSERRHAARRADWGHVELSPEMRKYVQDEAADPARIVDLAETVRERQQQLSRSPDGLSEEEAAVLQLMRIRERKTELYAQALGITHLPFDQQQREVKRVKDRITKKLQRAEARHG